MFSTLVSRVSSSKGQNRVTRWVAVIHEKHKTLLQRLDFAYDADVLVSSFEILRLAENIPNALRVCRWNTGTIVLSRKFISHMLSGGLGDSNFPLRCVAHFARSRCYSSWRFEWHSILLTTEMGAVASTRCLDGRGDAGNALHGFNTVYTTLSICGAAKYRCKTIWTCIKRKQACWSWFIEKSVNHHVRRSWQH